MSPILWTPADTLERDIKEQVEAVLDSMDFELDALDSAPFGEINARLDKISKLVTRARNTLKRL